MESNNEETPSHDAYARYWRDYYLNLFEYFRANRAYLSMYWHRRMFDELRDLRGFVELLHKRGERESQMNKDYDNKDRHPITTRERDFLGRIRTTSVSDVGRIRDDSESGTKS